MDSGHRRSWTTMRDVARRAGVSAMTVSRVLKAPHKVAPATRAKVEAAVAALGYVPDDAARSLSSRHSRLVAALVSTVADSIFASTVDGLAESLRAHGRHLLLGTTEYSALTEEALLLAILSRRPDGVVLTSGVHTETTRRLLKGAGIPVVEAWELPDDPIDMAVGFSNLEAGRAMTRFLAELGYRRIGFVGGQSPDDHRGRRRAEGYRRALLEAGLGPPRMSPAETLEPIETGARGLSWLLDAEPDTDCVFCASDAVALGALSEARRRGLEVPGQLAVAGLGDFDFAGPSGLCLTTMRIPGRTIGSEAGRMLIERRLHGRAPGASVVDVGFELVRRATA